MIVLKLRTFWFTSKLQGRKILTCWNFCNLNLTFISYSFWNIRRKVLKGKKKIDEKGAITPRWVIKFTSKLQGRKILTCCKFLQFKLISYRFWNIRRKVLIFFYKFDEKRARTPRWVIRFTSKLQVKKKIDRRVKPPDTILEENHPMTISSKFCSYWANGFRQKDFYGNFP